MNRISGENVERRRKIQVLVRSTISVAHVNKDKQCVCKPQVYMQLCMCGAAYKNSWDMITITWLVRIVQFTKATTVSCVFVPSLFFHPYILDTCTYDYLSNSDWELVCSTAPICGMHSANAKCPSISTPAMWSVITCLELHAASYAVTVC
jgi:hypothetical protein